MTNSADHKLQEVARLIKAGDIQAGRQQLREILKENPNNANAWYLASFVTDNPDQRRSALERALKINPQHVQAQTHLNRLLDSTRSTAPVAPIQTSSRADPHVPISSQKPQPELTSASSLPPMSEKVVPTKVQLPLYLYVFALIAALFVIVGVVGGILFFRELQASGSLGLDMSRADNKLLFSEKALLNVISSDGRNIVPVPVYDNLNQGGGYAWTGMFSLSPDGKHVLLGSEKEFFSTDSAGQHQQSLGAGIEQAWSPDGMRIAFTRVVGQQTDIFTADADGNNIKQITTIDAADRQPVWSPDSKRIVFIRFDSTLPSLYIINGDGTGEAKLTDGNMPDWSPDGTRIVFAASGPDGTAIYLIGVDGKGQTMLANGSKPQWSPDGRYILFQDKNTVVKIAPDGSGKVELGKGDQYLASPDSSHIAIWGGPVQLLIANVNGENPVSVKSLHADVVSWSPDSKQIGLESQRIIFIVNLDGTYKNIVNAPLNTVKDLSSQRALGNIFMWLTPTQYTGISASVEADRQARLKFAGSGPDRFLIRTAPLTILSADIDHTDAYVQDPIYSEQRSTAFVNWSPDGQRVALDLILSKDPSQSGIYLLSSTMTNLRKLTNGRKPVWSPDSKRIAFASGENEGSLLYVTDAKFGATPVKISDQPLNDRYYRWSPDGTRLLFVSGKEIFVGNADGSGATSIASGSFPDWSNDGKQIVYDGRDGLTICDLNGATVVKLPVKGNHPVWSPDGTLIAFDDNLSILTVHPDGSNLQHLTSSTSWGVEPAWSADGKRLLYRTDTTGSELRLINADGSGHHRIASAGLDPRWAWLPSSITLPSSAFIAYNKANQPNIRPSLTTAELYGGSTPTLPPTVKASAVAVIPSAVFTPTHPAATSPVPTSLAPTSPTAVLPPSTQTAIPAATKREGRFALSIYGPSHTIGTADLYLMNFDGADLQRLTQIEGDDLSPDWSPDGKQIAFTSSRDGNSEIYLMNADGSDQKRLTTNHTDDIQPFWSPDGQCIGFSSWRDGNLEIYTMNADGTSQKRLTNTQDLERFYGWSPDGSKLLMVTTYDKRTYDGIITVMNADGTGLTKLKLSGQTPTWSPDGNHILLATNGGTTRHIIMANADGTNVVQISRDSNVDDSHPKWSPDGTAILFMSSRDLKYGMYVMNPDGSNVQLVSRQGDEASGPDWTLNATISDVRTEVVPAGTPIPTTEQLAFVQNGQIFLTNIDGSDPMPMLPGDTTQRWFPRISPDAKTIGYTIQLSERMQVFLMKSDGTGQRKPLDTGGWEGGTVWSPDGKQIAFLSSHRLDNGKSEAHLNVVDVDGNNPRVLVMRSDGSGLELPSWSPDGKQMVYTVVQRNETSIIGKQLYMINVDGSDEHVILADKFFNSLPVWSPDGKRIAFTSTRDEGVQLFVMDANGQNAKALTQAGKAIDSVVWSPDSKRLIYGVYQDSNMSKYYILSLESGEQIPIQKLYESIIFWGQLPRPTLPGTPASSTPVQ